MNTRRVDETLENAARSLGAARDRRSAPLLRATQDAIGAEIGQPQPAARPAPNLPAVRDGRATQRNTVRAMLASRSALRQAIILTEILGPPKSLRREG